MDKLTEAKTLSAKAENYLSEGNYHFAVQCYDKIIQLLKQALTQATSKDSIEAIRLKIAKFIEKKASASVRQAQKEESRLKVSTLGFPKMGLNRQTFDMAAMKKNQPQLVPQNIRNNKTMEDKRHKVFDMHRPKVDLDPAVQDLIVKKLDISFKDIVGMKDVKAILQEAVIRPRQRPDLYTGIRAPPRGILLYGPPGNGKTYICKALAKESGCTFFALSASAILNRLVGQSQKMIKKVFHGAQLAAPSIIFIDQIDSMLTARSQNQHEASRRLKTQFLVLMDGINSPKSGQVLVIGATNLPNELDSAAKRRFSKTIYIGHPDAQSRKEMILRNMTGISYDLSSSDMKKLIDKLQYFSASEIRNICAEACMLPLRQLGKDQFTMIAANQLRKVNFKDYMNVMADKKPIVSKEELVKYRQK